MEISVRANAFHLVRCACFWRLERATHGPSLFFYFNFGIDKYTCLCYSVLFVCIIFSKGKVYVSDVSQRQLPLILCGQAAQKTFLNVHFLYGPIWTNGRGETRNAW